jgi:trehalose 6-phosphate synthase
MPSEPETARESETIAWAATLRRSVQTQLLIGLDRLHRTKGISRHLLAYETLLRAHPELRERVQLIQGAPP